MADYIGELRTVIGTRPIIMCGANVILINSKNEILLHHRVDNDSWGLPGGAMELEESLEDTARREVFEELGLSCGDLKLFNVYSGKDYYYKYPDGNEVFNVTATYLCREFEGEMVVDPVEGKEAKYFALDEIPKPLSEPIKKIIEEFLQHEK